MTNKHKTTLMISISLLLFFSQMSCGGPKQNEVVSPQSSLSGEFDGAPDWVLTRKCEKPVVENPKQMICGVGQRMVESPRRLGLSQTAAEADGASKIALILQRRVETISKTYQAEWSVETDQAQTDYEDTTKKAIKEIAKLKLNGVRSAASWISPNNNLYVLMVVSPEAVKDALTNMAGLDARIKATIDHHADELFQELDGEEAP